MAELIDGVWHQARPGGAGRFGCLKFISEEAEMHLLPVDLNLGMPLGRRSMPTDAAIGRCRSPIARLVLKVGGQRKRPEIRATIIQRVAVPMVAFGIVTVHQAEQLTMQEDQLPVGLSPQAATDVSRTYQMPAPLTGPLSISRIDHGVRTDRSINSGQGDHRRRRIIARQNRQWRTTSGSASALRRAETASPSFDISGYRKEVNSALLTDARNGTIGLHQDSPPGVTPPAVSSSAGVSCRPNYIRSLRVGAP